MGLGWVASGTSPGLGIALVSFGVAGFGNGLLLVHERLLIQAVVPEHLQGRIFAVSDTVVSWAFAIAFLGAGPLLEALGVRETIVIGGGFALLFAAAATFGLRNEWTASRTASGQPAREPT